MRVAWGGNRRRLQEKKGGKSRHERGAERQTEPAQKYSSRKRLGSSPKGGPTTEKRVTNKKETDYGYSKVRADKI